MLLLPIPLAAAENPREPFPAASGNDLAAFACLPALASNSWAYGPTTQAHLGTFGKAVHARDVVRERICCVQDAAWLLVGQRRARMPGGKPGTAGMCHVHRQTAREPVNMVCQQCCTEHELTCTQKPPPHGTHG